MFRRDILIPTVLVLVAVAMGFWMSKARAQVPNKPDLVEVIEIGGPITEATASWIKDQVEKVGDNPKVKAVLLAVNSPGGSVSPTSVIYHELAKIKVPVVGLCEYLCASGGAYVLMSPSVKFIAVRPDTIGGSIGVIWQHTRFHRLLDWAKIDNEAFKSGVLKDSGNPTRDLTGDDRKYMQGIVDELAQRFYEVVTKARPKLTAEQVAQLKSARIFIGDKIVAAGLADAVMNGRPEAVAKAKELSGSKLIFTREEIKKMSKAADDHSGGGVYGSEPPRPRMGWEADLGFLVDTLREVRQGSSDRVEYRMPYQF